jgi:hypothetical protein
MYGIDTTFKIIPKSFSPYKLMTIYAIDNKLKKSNIAAFICLKYKDSNSLIKIFNLFRAIYYFSPISVNCDFENSQIYTLKHCELFNQKHYIIPCLFHYEQSIIRKLKTFKINIRSLE